MKAEEYFNKWAENCRVFIDYKPIHSHEDMMQFAEDYHKEKQRELLIAYEKQHYTSNEWVSVSKQCLQEIDDFLKNQNK